MAMFNIKVNRVVIDKIEAPSSARALMLFLDKEGSKICIQAITGAAAEAKVFATNQETGKSGSFKITWGV